MSYRDNLHSVTANLVQQASAAIVLFSVPAMLGVQDYGKATAASTLISLMGIADLGVAGLYSRRMPAVIASGSVDEMERWNVTVFWFRTLTATAFGATIACYYATKYGRWVESALLLLLVPAMTVAAFSNAYETVHGQFRRARDLSLLQSITRLLVVPGTLLHGLSGWFAGQLLGAFLVFLRKDVAKLAWHCRRWSRYSWGLISRNFTESLALCLISVLWMQFLFSARLAAVIVHPDEVVAKYGIANAFYQGLALLAISAFVPQSLKIYRMWVSDPTAAVGYTFRIALWSVPVVAATTAAGLIIAKLIMDHFFSKYGVGTELLAALVIGLLNFPALASFGSLLIASAKLFPYCLLLAGGLAFDWYLTGALEPAYGERAAAVAQLFALSAYSVVLTVYVSVVLRQYLQRRWHAVAAMLPSLAGPGIFLALFTGRG